MDETTMNKFQHQFWVTKQTVFKKLGKKEDECIVASDASLDAKLELFKSISQTSIVMNKLLDRYQEKICFLAQEQNSMGRFLKEAGKNDKSSAGKMMTQMGKSLIYCSQQEISLRPPLLRLYQEVETFRERAVDDTLDTIKQMERNRTEYRASLNWMKNVSQELDPDTYRQMEKFRKVQTHVKKNKSKFDRYKLACLQKVDLLAAARCNMFSHALINYQGSTIKTTEKIAKIFNTLASTFKGYQHFEFCVIKDLAEPSNRLSQQSTAQNASDELFFDFENNDLPLKASDNSNSNEDSIANNQNNDETTDLLGLDNNSASNLNNLEPNNEIKARNYTVEDLLSSEIELENLLGAPIDVTPETEKASEALDLSLLWPTEKKSSKNSQKKDSSGELLGGDEFNFDTFSIDGPESSDSVALLNDLLTTPQPSGDLSSLLIDNTGGGDSKTDSIDSLLGGGGGGAQNNAGFLPSQLLDFGNLGNSEPGDLLNFTSVPLQQKDKNSKKPKEKVGEKANWYDIFADLDPISNPDAIGKPKDEEERDNRYC